MKDETKEAVKVVLISAAGAVLGLIIAILFPMTHGKHGDPGVYYPVNMALSMSMIFLLISLLRIHIADYREMRARFTLGLVIFLSTLLLQAIFSLPAIHAIFGFSSRGLGPFSIIINALEVFALAVFLYLSGNP